MNKILLTIDTEGPRGNDPIMYQIWGKVSDGQRMGIPKIIEICNRYNVKGLFFVDIAEMWDLGFEKIREVVTYIIKEGHDVGMHIHPHHYPNEKRHFLFDYTKDEQYTIIRECTQAFVKITGIMPKSFRAGKYGANQDTLDIINELGYKYDFSEFYSNKWCGIKPDICYILPVKYKQLVEFPVTIYKSLNLGKLYTRYDKLEVTENTNEIWHIIKRYNSLKQDGVIILFMHSFSFLNWLTHPDSPTVEERNLRRFESLISKISSDENLNFISEKDLDNISISKSDSPNNILSTKNRILQLWYTYLRAYDIRRTNKRAKCLVFSVYLLVLIAIITILFLMQIF